MKLLDHKNNSKWWNMKIGQANAAQVVTFAKNYQLAEPCAWAVTVSEGDGWIGASHVCDVMSATRAVGAVAVWISDGLFAQCVWRAD